MKNDRELLNVVCAVLNDEDLLRREREGVCTLVCVFVCEREGERERV